MAMWLDIVNRGVCARCCIFCINFFMPAVIMDCLIMYFSTKKCLIFALNVHLGYNKIIVWSKELRYETTANWHKQF